MADYTLKNIDKEFWRKVKTHAASMGLTIKSLIIMLLKKEMDIK